MRLDGLHEQAITRPLSHDELVQLQRVAAQAGTLLMWVDKDMAWRAPRDGRPGRPPTFSDAAVQFCLSIKGEGRPGNAPVARFSPERAEPRTGSSCRCARLSGWWRAC